MTTAWEQAWTKHLGSATSEAEFQATVIKDAKQLGWRVYHTHDSRRSNPGFPDLVLVRERVIWAELKTAHGRVNAQQQAWIDRLQAAGQEAYLWRPQDIHEITRILARRAA